MSRFFRAVSVFVLCFTLLPALPAQARPKHLFKVASLAPEGSVWIKRFREFAGEVDKASNGEVGFKIYPGGVMGDDRAMFRKMKVGQLHGGGFTMTGIGPIVADFRVMSIPFLFCSYDEVDFVRKGLTPHFQRVFAEKGLELVALTEVGFVYTMSTMPISTLEELRSGSAWTPDNDPVSSAFLETLGVSPTPLAIPDVLTSLQTGLVDTVFNSLYGSIVLQWFTKTKYIIDTPFGYAYGAFLLDRKTFHKLPEKHAKLIRGAAEKHFGTLLADTRKSNDEAQEVLQNNGVSFVTPSAESVSKLQDVQDRAVERIKGSAFSAQVYDEAMRLLGDYRGQQDASAVQ